MSEKKSDKKTYYGIGVMSGTSLDGLDIVSTLLELSNGCWNYKILNAKTYPYEDSFVKSLSDVYKFKTIELIKFHNYYGRYIGNNIVKFIKEYNVKPDYIASHGHTVIHNPNKKYTLQIGSGAEIYSVTGITTVSDFRTQDIALNGQGAPLVPMGDKLLFSDYDATLNIGGFSNITILNAAQLIAFDICPSNIILNFFALKEGIKYDKDGEIGKKGSINEQLLKELDNLDFYSSLPPKSLARQWVENNILPVINKYNISNQDMLRTLYEHIAGQIVNVFNYYKINNTISTGGGTKNSFLIELIRSKTKTKIIIPDSLLIDYKEALIFSLLGLLRLLNEVNVLKSVTGAKKDSSSGVIWGNIKQ